MRNHDVIEELGIWRFEPLDAKTGLWRFSRYRGPVIVRAVNEQHARFLVAEKFGVGAIWNGTHLQAGNPWSSPFTTSCEQLTADERWPALGPPKVLWFEGPSK